MDTTLNSQAELEELLAAIEDASERFLKERGGLAVPRRQRTPGRDAKPQPEFDRRDWREIANLGWPGILVPSHLGGLGLDLRAAAALARKVGRWLAPEPYTISAGVVTTLLAGSETTAAETLLPDVMAGEYILGVALDLDEYLEDLPSKCIVEVDLNGVRYLSGKATYVAPFDPADGWLIAAVDNNHRPVLLHVQAGCQGLSVEPQLEADGRQRATLRFSGYPLPEGAIIAEGEQAADLLRRSVQVGHVLYAAELLGAAERLQEITLEHLQQRHQFGRPIGSFQALQHRCVDVRIQLELAHASLEEAARPHAEDRSFLMDELGALRAKLRASRAAMEAALAAVHLHGAMGITDECDVGLYFKRILCLMPRFGSERSLQKRWLEVGNAATKDVATGNEWEGEFPTSADWEAMPESQFRCMVRAFLARNYPDRLRHMPRRVHWHEIGDWYRCLSRQGWIAPAWPTAHGGMGLSPTKQIAWLEEFESYGVARAPDQGILMVGPILMQYGSPEQQRHYLPRILTGEDIWCQGYSEPNAGSDLASLRTEAALDDDHFVVTGQKIWTTLAQDATHIFMLVRTDKTVKPQAGISFLLCDLKSPGITVRPIMDLAGNNEFCEVFFDGARVPRENLVGSLNEGWTIAKALLGFERLHLGSPKQSQHALGHLRTLGQLSGLMEDAAFQATYAELALDVADLASLYSRYADYAKRGERLPPSVSMLKIWATETYQRIGLAITRHSGSSAALAGAVEVGGRSVHLLAPLFNATAAKIYGGANEVQRNILARTVLALPS